MAYTWSITSGNMPSGLLLDISQGIISGTPIVAGTFSFTVSVTDGLGGTGTQEYALIIDPAQVGYPLLITPPVLPKGAVGVAYSVQLTADVAAPQPPRIPA